MPVHCVKHDRHRAVNTSKCKQPFVMGNVENPSLFVHRQADHFPTKGTSHCSHTLPMVGLGVSRHAVGPAVSEGRREDPAAEPWAMLCGT